MVRRARVGGKVGSGQVRHGGNLLWTATALVVLVLSLLGPLGAAVSAAATVALAGMHLAWRARVAEGPAQAKAK